MVAYPRTAPATATCRIADQVSGLRHSECSKKMSAPAAILIQRLRHDAHVRDARLLYRIHHCRECSEGHVFVGANKDGLMLRVPYLLTYLGRNFIDVDCIVPQKNALRLVNRDHQPLLGDFLD